MYLYQAAGNFVSDPPAVKALCRVRGTIDVMLSPFSACPVAGAWLSAFASNREIGMASFSFKHLDHVLLTTADLEYPTRITLRPSNISDRSSLCHAK